MKKLLSLLGLLILVNTGYAQLSSKVDERFELTSMVFTLAGVPEYGQCRVPSYWQDIITVFEPYYFTEPINYIRELNQRHSIGYNAVSTTAAMLEIKNGKIRLQPQYDISKISERDPRWTPELFSKYIKMLNVFYKESNFHEFYKKHQPLYDVAEQRMDQLLANTTAKWFESFFGKPLNADIQVYISLVNGPNNYAMPGGVLIGINAESEGLPNPTMENTTYTLIHELCHHYTNSLFYAHWPQMEAAGNKMHPYVKDRMAQIAYGDARTVLCEWMNNLFTLMYTKESGVKYAEDILAFDLKEQVERGFIWMPRSVEFMENFYAHRDLYPHIEAFMPQLIAFVNSTADQYDVVIDEFEHRKPFITNVYPVVGSDITGFKEIVVTFSEPMAGSYGFYGRGTDDPNVKQLELDWDNIRWSDDKYQIILPLARDKAESNCTYGIQFSPRPFASNRYFWLDDRCENLLFKTGE